MQFELNITPSIFLPCYRKDILNYDNRYNIFWGGRASGKTKYIILKMLIKGLSEKRLILLMRKETNKLKDSVWKELLEEIDNFHITQYFKFNYTELRATCTINGTEFKCLGLDDPEKIKGYALCSDIFLDEITSFTQDDYELIDGTLRSNKYKLPLQIYASFNPVSKANWVYKYFMFDKGEIPNNTYIKHTTYLDNPFLPNDFINRMNDLKERNYNRWKIEALGEWVTLDKLVYTNWEVLEFNNTDIDGDLLVGLDYGFVNDPSAIVASILKEDEKKIYIFKTYTAKNKTNPELADIIKELGFSKSIIIADSAEQKSIEELRRLGIYRIKPSVKGKDSIIHGILKIQQYDLIIHPACEDIINELQNYTWKKDRQSGEYINEPVDLYNHCLDAFRYSLLCVGSGVHILSKSVLGI